MTPVIKCENCDETCGTVDSLGHHISTNHKEELPIAVFDSSRTDTYKETTPAEASEEENVDPKFEGGNIMKAIPKSLESVDKLKEHFDSCHNFKCKNCDETCETVDSLGQHISTNHKEELPIAVSES